MHHVHAVSCSEPGHETRSPAGTKSRNGEMRNEKLEMRKWKWSSLLLVDNTEVDAIVYLWCIKRSVVKVLFVKIIDTIIDLL